MSNMSASEIEVNLPIASAPVMPSIAEIVASTSGIGFELWTARRYGKTPEVFAGILMIGIIGLVSDQAIRFLHRRWFRYLH